MATLITKAPSKITLGVGQPFTITGVSLSEDGAVAAVTYAVSLTDTNGLLSATAIGGASIAKNGTTGPTISPTGLTDVNATLATLSDKDSVTPSDTIKINATDSTGNMATEQDIAVTVNGVPTITSPSTIVLPINIRAPLSGITVAESGDTSTETFTLSLSDANGVFNITGGSSPGTALTVNGSLGQINADLTNLTYANSITPSDAITINVKDSFGNTASSVIGVSVFGPPALNGPSSATVVNGVSSPIAGIVMSEGGAPPPANETFALTVSDTDGKLAVKASGGATVGGNNTSALTIGGSLADVNATLASLADTDSTADTIILNGSDNSGNKAPTQTISVNIAALNPPVITDNTANPLMVQDGQTLTAWKAITVAEPNAPLTATETVTANLTTYYYYYGGAPNPGPGTIGNPNGGGSFTPNTFTESGVIGGDPTFATKLLSTLQYHAPTIPDGYGEEVFSTVTVNNGSGAATDTKQVDIFVVTPPAVTGDVLNQPIASGGGTDEPFATTQVTDQTFNFAAQDSATITITDGGGPTDADGLLSGAGLSRNGPGNYSLGATYPYNIGYLLTQLSFAPTAVGAGVNRTTMFDLAVTNTRSNLIGKSTDSVVTIGASAGPPIIANTKGGQTVVTGSSIKPLAPVTVSDPNPGSPSDSATITLLNSSGSATDANGSLVDGKALIEATKGSGVYTLAATDPTTLTTELNSLSFVPVPLASGASPITTTFKLDVTNASATPPTATDSKTTVMEIQQPPDNNNNPDQGGSPPPATNFLVSDQTTGAITKADGTPYTGPVAGLTQEIILLTSDNINVTSTIPNVFIHTGSGDDAIDVSQANGNNVLDGSTGSNFLTGGTGKDEFYVDDRNRSADIWSTVRNMHGGDKATIWGITQQDAFTTGNDVLPTAPGLDFAFSGKPSVNLTLTGYSTVDLSNGRLSVAFGSVDGNDYMQIHANS